MSICFYGKVNEDFEKIIDYWNSKPALVKGIGDLRNTSTTEFRANDYINEISEHLFKVPFNSDFNFSKGQLSRLKREIDNVNDAYTNGTLSTFKKYFYVGEAIANHSPVTRKFYHSVNEAINYERNNLDYYMQHSQDVSKQVRTALIQASGLGKGKIKEMQKEFSDLEKRILKGGSEEDQAELLERYESLFNFNGENVMDQYRELMEIPTAEFNRVSKDYNRHVVKAVKSSRKVLDKMGGVLINGLDRMSNVVKLLADNPLHTRAMNRYLKRIEDAKGRVKIGIEQGDYLPHFVLENVVEINHRMKGLMESKNESSFRVNAEQIVDRIEGMVPGVAKSRNEALNNIWSKNPLFILDRYSKDVIAFNKINFLQEAFIPAIRRFQAEDVNPEFVKSMRTYLEDTFQVATKGMGDRPDWVNNMVRWTMAAETIKSMGLSFTGAVRNGASSLWYFSTIGRRGLSDTIKKYNSTYSKELADIEREQGFTFTEGGKELIAEGLIPSSVRESDVKYDPITDKVTYVDKGIIKSLDPVMDKVVGKSLMFHRITENLTRQWMFRSAYIQSKEILSGHQVKIAKDDTFDTEKSAAVYAKRNEEVIKKKATQFAIKAVNSFAFEYAAHAKARIVGGVAPTKLDPVTGQPVMRARDYVGAMGEVAFQFMHYPMSFAHLQAKTLRGAKDAALSRQWDAPEIKHSLKFAGLATMVHLFSSILNTNFTTLIQHDTLERVKDFVDYMTLDEETLEARNKRGLINEFTGPAIGDMLYVANMMQLYSTEDREWLKLMTGYRDYYAEGDVPDWVGPEKKLDTTEKHEMWKRMSISLERLITKDWPAIRDGRGMTDILRHELGLYPYREAEGTRNAINAVIESETGIKPFRMKKGRQVSGERALDDLLLELKLQEQNK